MSNAGRKNKYETNVKPRLETIRAWRRKGLTDPEIYTRLKISHDSFYDYKKKYIEFSDTLRESLDEAVSNVENAHYKAACGYEIEEKKEIYETETDENGVKTDKLIRTEVIKKQVQPNVTAQIHFLKNRDSKNWHDRSELEIMGKDGGDINITVTHNTTGPDGGENE